MRLAIAPQPGLDAGAHGNDDDRGRVPDPALCTPQPGAGCSDVATPGTATITAIATADSTLNDCPNDSVSVTFTFESSDPARVACDTHGPLPTSPATFTIFDGKSPPRSCVAAMGLIEGKRVQVTRKDIITGVCTPLLYEFPKDLVTRCESACM